MNVKDFESNISDEQLQIINEIFEIDVHWIDQAHKIFEFKEFTGYSERELAKILQISKSEIHRLLVVGKLSESAREGYKALKVDKWAIYELIDAFKTSNIHTLQEVSKLMLYGKIKSRSQLRNYLCVHGN